MMAIGDRFKRYEEVSDGCLTKRTPVIARIDGRSFHTLTRGFEKPYDQNFARAMRETAISLCKEVQGCKLAYVQSDEISLLLVDYDTIETQAWFDYRVQKMVSISASLASLTFTDKIRNTYPGKSGHFDARFFNVPANDVCNYFVWRQRDAERNSLQSLAQANFSHKSLHGLDSGMLVEKLMKEKGIDYGTLESFQKRGAFVHKVQLSPIGLVGFLNLGEAKQENETVWLAKGAPSFSENRSLIEDFLPEFKKIIDEPARV